MINARNKGQRGEREFGKWIKELLELDFDPCRNYDQSATGGADFVDIGNFRFEVKRCQKLSLRDWWVQVCHKALPAQIPVVVYRQNHGQWLCQYGAVKKKAKVFDNIVEALEFLINNEGLDKHRINKVMES